MTELTERKRDILEKLAEMRMHRRTYAECAAELRMSERHLKRLAQLPEFKQVFEEMQREWRAWAKGRVAEAADKAIQVMLLLAGGVDENNRPISPYVRVQAARALGDWLDLQGEHEERTDDSEELLRAQLEISKRLQELGAPQLHFHLGPNQVLVPLPQGETVDAEVRELPPGA